MRKVVIFFSILIVILISGASCESVDTNRVDQLEKDATQIKSDLESLKQEVESLKNVPVNAEVKEEAPKETELDTTGKFDLSTWTADNILDKFKGDYRFAKTEWYTYEYNGENYYDKFGQKFYGKDEFYKLAYKASSREADVSHLRIFKLGLKEDPKDEYKAYKEIIKIEDSIDVKMRCNVSIGCANVEINECSKNDKKFFAWYADSYLFTARDNGEALEAFNNFYC